VPCAGRIGDRDRQARLINGPFPRAEYHGLESRDGSVLQLVDSTAADRAVCTPGDMPPLPALGMGRGKVRSGYSATIGRWTRLLCEQCVSRKLAGSSDGGPLYFVRRSSSLRHLVRRDHPDPWRDPAGQTANSVPGDLGLTPSDRLTVVSSSKGDPECGSTPLCTRKPTHSVPELSQSDSSSGTMCSVRRDVPEQSSIRTLARQGATAAPGQNHSTRAAATGNTGRGQLVAPELAEECCARRARCLGDHDHAGRDRSAAVQKASDGRRAKIPALPLPTNMSRGPVSADHRTALMWSSAV